MPDLKRIQDTLESIHHSWRYLNHEECPSTLLAALQEKCPHLDPESWEERFAWGGIYLNGRAATCDREINAPCEVEYYEPRFIISEAASIFPAFRPDMIVFEDEDLLAAFKPHGLPSLPPRDQKHYHLKGFLQKHVGHQIHMPSRLDRSAAGLTLVSKSARMHPQLQRAFEGRTVKKFYLLECSQDVDWEKQNVDLPITRDPAHPILRKVANEGGKRALTRFTRLRTRVRVDEHGDEQVATLLQAEPLSGRTHQIRVHSAHLGLPIIGDNFYDGVEAKNLHLLCLRYILWNPFTKEELDLSLPQKHLPSWADTHPEQSTKEANYL